MPDELFADPRLVRIDDHFDGPRDDVALYVGLVEEFGARSVLGDERLTLTSNSTLRLRRRSELDNSLHAVGFDIVDVGDAPDRPGLESVFLARRR